MFKIAICDDDQLICEDLEKIIKDYSKENNPDIAVDIFDTAVQLSHHIKEKDAFDLIFLDVEMEDLNGIEFGKWLRDTIKDELTKIVYISYQKDHALDLFRIRPMDFLPKPIKAEDVIFNIEKSIELLGEQSKFFLYKFDNGTRMIPSDSILYFESSNRIVIAHTTKGEVKFYEKLEEVEARLDGRYYWRIHKSYLINRSHVERFTLMKITMKDGKVLSVSQPYRDKIKEMQVEQMGKGK